MTTQLSQYTERLTPLMRRYGVIKAAFFGSLVSGTFRKGQSDVDILVLPPRGMSLLDFIGLKQDIEDMMHMDIDLLSYNGISPYLKKSILSNEQVFYETK
ncbi:MAG: nucleotidyltransferase domain-containing protein [Candidatus Gottesmanbacteria bacterium]|nr:nucleotidyltransferase domain-containing protein [Candidatus Gottesmanbacteria bacterium]